MYYKYSEDDQLNLEELIKRWPGDNKFEFRKSSVNENKLLFVHQNNEQRRLLELYGGELTCLDATYKTTQYALPLFFVVVKTNSSYQVMEYEELNDFCMTQLL